MSARRPPVPPIIVEVPVDEIQNAKAALNAAEKAGTVHALTSAHVQVQAMLTHMLCRQRRMASGGGA